MRADGGATGRATRHRTPRGAALLASALAMLVTAPAARAAPDPVLALAEARIEPEAFGRFVAAAVARLPALEEAAAEQREATAARLEARAALLPSADLSLYSSRVLARAFSNDPDNVYERSRANSRSDLTASVNQLLVDFGASGARIGAAAARLRAAAAGVDAAADQSALRTIAAWYDVFTYRALATLAEQQAAQQRAVRADLALRIERGYSAAGDQLQVDSALAATAARAAGYQRQLAAAEARFAELAGAPAPIVLGRAPVPPLPTQLGSDAAVRAAAARTPAVRAAIDQAAGARSDAQAAHWDQFPTVALGLDAGRYGVFEDRRDYDVRARVTIRQRLSVGLVARARQADARADGAEARARRLRDEAERDAAIAWNDARALDSQTDALRASYVAARESRAMLAERFRMARGTLLDVLAAGSAEFGAAVSFLEGIGERDAARYALLSRTGGLLPALGIDAAAIARQAALR